MQPYLLRLNEQQKLAVLHEKGPLLIAAGAGSGKTKTLTTRLIHLLDSGVPPEKIIAITFTNKAAQEMKNRILNPKSETLNPKQNWNFPFIGTFHSLGARILKEEGNKLGRTPGFTIFDSEDSTSLVRKILQGFNLPKEKFHPIKLASDVSRIKDCFVELDEESANNEKDRIFNNLFQKYEETLRESNAFDFGDLIQKVVFLFEKYPDILKKYQECWEHILVDEFQDVNDMQYAMVKFLAQKHRNLFVIGDDAQSIYGFRGSNFKIFLNFEEDWKDAKLIKLEQNYRSSQNIIRAASQLISKNKMQKPKTLYTENSKGSAIKLPAFQNNDEESWGIIESIHSAARNGESLKEVAILYRTNAQSRAVEQALIQSRIPYEIFGGLTFYERKEIKDLLAGLRYAFNPKDIVSQERLIKNFPKSKSAILLQELPRLSDELSLVELIRFFMEETKYREYLQKNFDNPEERMENIKELINFASNFQNAQEFLERVALSSSLDSKPNRSKAQKLNADSVKLMSIHLAKGLEFEQIFLIGANEGLLPHERSMLRSDDLEEERRLMYVAMTRAKNHLHISFYNLPSRFLGEIPPELIEFKKSPSAGRIIDDWDEDTIYLE